MAINVEEYQKLKQKAAEVRSQIDRAEGTLTTLMKTLKTDFGCETIEEAEVKLDSLNTELKDLELAYNTEMEKFRTKYGDLLK